TLATVGRTYQSGLDRLRRDVRRDILDRAGGRRLPVELERRVDVGEGGADGVAAADEDDGCEERRAADDPLRRAGDLDPVEADTVPAGAVLAGQLADLRFEPERAQRRDDPRGAGLEARLDAGRDVGARRHLLEDDRALVVHHGVAAALTQHRFEAVAARRRLRRVVAG